MSDTVHPIINNLFTSSAPPCEPVKFSWRLIRRKGRPFMLLPRKLTPTRVGITLYSAQRWPAICLRNLLPWVLQTPAAHLFEPIYFEASASAELVKFVAGLPGVGDIADALAAIKINSIGASYRLVLLLCDAGGRPTYVIKAGLDEASQRDINREADFLEKLPPNTIGCIRMTSRLRHPFVSAFVTDYFPGKCPRNDAGMELLFHTWLSHGPAVPLSSLPAWQKLDAVAAQSVPEKWAPLKRLLAGKMVRSTLYHGDFAPWNIRTINALNLQAFDWERGQLDGIPGWDWFHFTIQTSILPNRHSSERTAAEVEQLIHSERFKRYADAAGIGDVVQPMVLAYLLHHRWVNQPGDGRQATMDLFDFLATLWLLPASATSPHPARLQPPTNLPASPRRQLKFAVVQWANLFWEPQLNSCPQPSWAASFKHNWRLIAVSGLLLAAVSVAQFWANINLMFLPFFLVICSFVTLASDRRWGSLMATAGALAGPLVYALKNSEYRLPEVYLWNFAMRFVVLQMCVLFVDRIRKQKSILRQQPLPLSQPGRLTHSWAVVGVSLTLLVLVALLDWRTNPHISFLPLYMVPCMILTLVLNLWWGLLASLIAVLIGTILEYPNYQNDSAEIFGWNLIMRFSIYLVVLGLLERLRRENILFARRRPKNH